LTEDMEFRYGALYCPSCRKVYHYRTHAEAGEPDDQVYACPECSHELQPVAVERFVDSSEEVLSVMQQLDEELGER